LALLALLHEPGGKREWEVCSGLTHELEIKNRELAARGKGGEGGTFPITFAKRNEKGEKGGSLDKKKRGAARSSRRSRQKEERGKDAVHG